LEDLLDKDVLEKLEKIRRSPWFYLTIEILLLYNLM
jgi:hypothetical protein